jgi:hypothetical protein
VKAAVLALAGAACGLWGCGGGEGGPPDPTVISIDPSSMTSSDTARATITVEAVLPFTVDYGTGEVTVFRSLLTSVGSVVVGGGNYENGGMLSAFIPSRLQPGRHDVAVTLSDGRVGILPEAFTVTPGAWPVGGFTIDTIPDPQAAGEPFVLTIRAQGAFSATFHGTVDYFVKDYSTYPVIAGPFTNGVWTQNVVLSSRTRGNESTHVTVTDLMGRIAVSNNFKVE